VLFAGFLLSLPLLWTEEVSSGCGAVPPGAPLIRSGWTIVSRDPQALILVGTLLVSALVLAVLARDARTGVRVAAHAVASLATALLFFMVQFAATFTLFTRIRILPGAWLGLGCLALALLEALVRTFGELLQLVRERRAKRTAPSPTPE